MTSSEQFDDTDSLKKLISGDLALTGGAVKIPVCTLQEILDTIWADQGGASDNPAYPCPASGGTLSDVVGGIVPASDTLTDLIDGN